MIAQFNEFIPQLIVVVIVSIVVVVITTYLIFSRYEVYVPNSAEYVYSDESFISKDELKDLLKSEDILTDSIQRIVERAEKQSELRGYVDYLKNFFLPKELRVFQSMAEFLITDGTVESGGMEILAGGWRNKHKILGSSGVSKRSLYGRSGILKRFEVLGLIVVRYSKSKWGGQKYQYCLNKGNVVVKQYMRLLWESRQETDE